jgi:hypothetical protein
MTLARYLVLPLMALLASSHLHADKADVVDVSVSCADTCRFNVTVEHSDSGWEHYADQWDVVAPDGSLLARRVLLHPHVNEQPFTRSLGNARIPAGVNEVILRARDSRHGWGGREMRVTVRP